MSTERVQSPKATFMQRSSVAEEHVVPPVCETSDALKLESVYPLGTIFNGFVTNVHNVSQLHFFMFAMNTANAQHLANVRYAASPPYAYKCLCLPREGYVFALRMGESTLLRAVRLRTLCITKLNEVFLPDIGRNYELQEDEAEMYHLPAKLRNPPGIAVLCQLRGINDDVTILPKNMRNVIRGLLFRCVKLRVDGYRGDMLRVQLLDVSLDKLQEWTDALGEEEHDFCYALKHTILYKPKYVVDDTLEETKSDDSFETMLRNKKPLSPITEYSDGSENATSYDDETVSLLVIPAPSTPSTLPSTPTSDRVTYTVGFNDLSPISCLSQSGYLNELCPLNPPTSPTSFNSTFSDTLIPNNSLADEEATLVNMRPLLGCLTTHIRPILGGTNVEESDSAWKRDILPALFLVDNRRLKVNYTRQALLTITPTCIGQLERFFGIVHHRDEVYMQHMWTDKEIPLRSRYNDSHTPYIFDIVLARHSGDCKWYRAKVVEINKTNRKILVFYVDYGGVEYVNAWNIANLGRRISKLPFQAMLFRLHDLTDITSTKAERDFGVNYLRKTLFKKTFIVRVVNNRNDELTVCFEDQRFSHVPYTLINWGLMKPTRVM